MNIRYWLPLTAALMLGLAACGSDNNPGDLPDVEQPDAGNPDTGTPDTGTPDTGNPDTGGPDTGTETAECDKAANKAHIAQIQAAQPVLDFAAAVQTANPEIERTKPTRTVTISFQSLADDPEKTCTATLQYKDLNDNNEMDEFEDWRKTPAERAAALLPLLNAAEKQGLMAHPALTDVPVATSTVPVSVSSETQSMVSTKEIRFGRTAAVGAQLAHRARWSNKLQSLAENSRLGIPFVLSSEPTHATGGGRMKSTGFSWWPLPLGMGATNNVAMMEKAGQIQRTELKAIGIRMALSVPADLFTDPRWNEGQFTFGDDPTKVANNVEAYVKGLQGAALDRDGVAAVLSSFPGAGAAKNGLDARLEKGRFLSYPGNKFDDHIAPFSRAISAGVAGVTPAYGIPETGTWSGQDGLIDGETIEQVGASFNQTLMTDLLRTKLSFSGLTLAPWGILNHKGLSPLGTPWGVEALALDERVAKAINAGIDQFGGLEDPAAIAAALAAGSITQDQIDAAAQRALELMFSLGLFENPYVDATKAASTCNTPASLQAARSAMLAGSVLLVNKDKPAGFLNGSGDGSQIGDPGNAGNGSGKVIPAPPGQVYVAAGCTYFTAGGFNEDYVSSVSTGYGEWTNYADSVNGAPVSTPAQRMAKTDYVLIRIAPAFKVDPDSGALGLPTGDLEYATTNSALLDNVRAAKNAIAATPASNTQIVVFIDGGRPPVVQELLDLGVSALFIAWNGTDGDGVGTFTEDDKAALDIGFGIFGGTAKLPVGLPASNAAATSQQCDEHGDGVDAAFVNGFGISTSAF